MRFWEGWCERGIVRKWRLLWGDVDVGTGNDNIVKSAYIFALYLLISTKKPIIIWRFC